MYIALTFHTYKIYTHVKSKTASELLVTASLTEPSILFNQYAALPLFFFLIIKETYHRELRKNICIKENIISQPRDNYF